MRLRNPIVVSPRPLQAGYRQHILRRNPVDPFVLRLLSLDWIFRRANSDPPVMIGNFLADKFRENMTLAVFDPLNGTNTRTLP